MKCFRAGWWRRRANCSGAASRQNKTAMQAIGYRQVVEHLHGERNLAETIEQVKIRTRQFAKRQLTWFRRHGNCSWIELKMDEAPEKCAEKISGAARQSFAAA